jgi:hypothetical protein
VSGKYYCDLCHEDVHTINPLRQCLDCERQVAYWDSLTPEQRADEERMIAQYVAETEAER